MCAEPHRKIGERSLEILESAIDREDLLVDCAPLRDGGGIERLARANPARYATEAARVAKKHSSSVFSPLGELANANGDK